MEFTDSLKKCAYNPKCGNVVSVCALGLAEEETHSKSFAWDLIKRRSALKD